MVDDPCLEDSPFSEQSSVATPTTASTSESASRMHQLSVKQKNESANRFDG